MRAKHASTRLAALAAAIALLLGLGGNAVAADPFDVYVVLPLTGNNSFAGNAAQQGLTAFESVVNAEGGIRGRPLNFVFTDTASSPEATVVITNNILTRHPALILGDQSVAGCNAMAALVKNGPVQFCLSPGFRPERGGYSYTIGLSAIEEAKVIFRFLRANGWNRIGLIVGTDATGRLAEPEFAARLLEWNQAKETWYVASGPGGAKL